jgi:hypothetical protein
MIASMDRSYMTRQPGWARRGEAVVTARLLSAAERDGQYVITYEVGKDGEPTRTVVSAVAMGTSPKGLRRFFTVSASCTLQEAPRFGGALRAAVDSFTPPS